MGCDGVFSRGSLVSSERNAFKTELPDAETKFCFYESKSEQLKQPARRLLLGPGDRHFSFDSRCGERWYRHFSYSVFGIAAYRQTAEGRPRSTRVRRGGTD